jgi:hypothetical protein
VILSGAGVNNVGIAMREKFLFGAYAGVMLSMAAVSAPASAKVYVIGSLNPGDVGFFPNESLPKSGAFTYDYTFTLTGSADVIVTAGTTISGIKSKAPTGIFELFDGTPPGGTPDPEPGNPATLVFSGGTTGAGLGGDLGYSLLPGDYYVEVKGISHGADPIGGNVTTTAVPEMSTWAMLGIGFAGVALTGFKKRRGARYAI